MNTILLNLEQMQFLRNKRLTLDMVFFMEQIKSGIAEKEIEEKIPSSSPFLSFLLQHGYLTKQGKLSTEGEKVLSDLDAVNKKDATFEAFLLKFWALFPRVKLPTGLNFQSHIVDVKSKLKYFQKKYKQYKTDCILEAARRYVQYAEEVNYQYIRPSKYFIYKQGTGSDLADWCEKVLGGDEQIGDVQTQRHI